MALLALDRPDEAFDACERCLAFDPENAGVKALRERACSAKSKKEEKERNHMEAVQREQEDRRRVREAFKVCSLPECMYNNISP